jgi:hypothetical protein
MARSAPTAAGVHTEITLEPLLEESTLKDRILSLQPREDQTFLSHVVFLKCRKALRETTRVITSQEQEAEKVSAKEKRMAAKTGKKRKRETEFEIMNKVVNLELVVEAQKKELADKNKEMRMKILELKKIRKECDQQGVILSITDGTNRGVGVGLRSAKKLKTTKAQIRVLLATAEMDHATAKSDEKGKRASYEAVFVEEEKIKELRDNALPEEKCLYQGKLERLVTDFKNRLETMNTAKDTTRMCCHRVVDLKLQLESEMN